jgi:hypothetical protein
VVSLMPATPSSCSCMLWARRFCFSFMGQASARSALASLTGSNQADAEPPPCQFSSVIGEMRCCRHQHDFVSLATQPVLPVSHQTSSCCSVHKAHKECKPTAHVNQETTSFAPVPVASQAIASSWMQQQGTL